MTFETALVLVVLGVAMALFATGRFPPDLIALGVLVIVALAGVLDAGQAIGGFANPAVVTIGAVYVMSSGLARTGVAYEIGRLIRRVSGGSERRLLAITMLVAAGLSGFMNAIAAAAVL
ncbi:MAG: SLC13 family permease, partial [Chloroflexi bacterium]|nr:SLC13 family permease [Chloroflexota bacterium]